MAKKGRRTTQKSLSVAKARKRRVKEKTWVISLSPGAHCKSESIPLASLLRDLLNASRNFREARFILRSKKVKVNCKVRTNPKFGVGIFDFIEIPEIKKAFRIVIEKKGRLTVKEIPFGREAIKICRIESKKTVKGGKTSLSTSDGRTIIMEKTELKPSDSVKVDLNSGKAVKPLPLQEGSIVLLTGGKHTGETATVKQIMPGKLRRKKLLTLEKDGESFQTALKNVFVVGVEKEEKEVTEWCL